MISRTRAAVTCGLVAALWASGAVPARAQSGGRLFVVGLPASELERLLADRAASVGLGVYPASRDPLRFMEEVSLGAPRETAGVGSPLGGAVGNLSGALLASGASVAVAGEGPPPILEGIRRALRLPPEPAFTPSGKLAGLQVIGVALGAAPDASRLIAGNGGAYVLVGFDARTPLLVATCRSGCRPGAGGPRAVLDGGIARRPGVVTPYDLAATILDMAGATRPERGFIGRTLRSRGEPNALGRVDGLARRLERDSSFAPALAATAVSLGAAGIIAALLLSASGRRTAGVRVGQGSALVFLGYIVALFIPSGSAAVRAIALVWAFALGVLLPTDDPPRTFARISLAAAAVMAALAIVAPLRPGGEPGLSIWGDPLVSWRFFGLQNFEAGFIATGVVVWGVLAGLGVRALAVASVVAALVIGAPRIGANFVGVLTFTLGAALALTALQRRRAETWQLAAAAGSAVVAFALALLADAGSPVSHGGQAVERVRQGGIGRAIDFVRIRIRLNLDLVRDFPGSFVWVAGLAVLVAALFWWGRRLEDPPFRPRAAVGAGAAMAACALVLEDSGFYVGTLLVYSAVVAWLLTTLSPDASPTLPTPGVPAGDA